MLPAALRFARSFAFPPFSNFSPLRFFESALIITVSCPVYSSLCLPLWGPLWTSPFNSNYRSPSSCSVCPISSNFLSTILFHKHLSLSIISSTSSFIVLYIQYIHHSLFYIFNIFLNLPTTPFLKAVNSLFSHTIHIQNHSAKETIFPIKTLPIFVLVVSVLKYEEITKTMFQFLDTLV